ncbi:hypothetical protein [Aureimonas sp. ME7]|uniref:hypothetical protein n=1 Tax=Aureimonas sp. ME7 TaxID=2744252 RepID=UPI0015F3CC6D|nr:hypothetical protein [Aureimonas sp. ME7]
MHSALMLFLGLAAATGGDGAGRTDPPPDISSAASPLLPKLCVDEPNAGRGVLRCAGLVGTDVFLGGADARAVALGTPVFQADPPGRSVLGRSVTWRILEGRPIAGIVGYELPEGSEGGTRYLVVIKPGRDARPGCVVGVLRQIPGDGLEAAASYADRRAVSFRCGTDAPSLMGSASSQAGQALAAWVEQLSASSNQPAR